MFAVPFEALQKEDRLKKAKAGMAKAGMANLFRPERFNNRTLSDSKFASWSLKYRLNGSSYRSRRSIKWKSRARILRVCLHMLAFQSRKGKVSNADLAGTSA
jgi:hypothetical protein